MRTRAKINQYHHRHCRNALNRSQGVTFIAMTHDPSTPHQTQRVLAMGDRRIVREDGTSSPLEEDLKMWRQPGLGQQIVAGHPVELQSLSITGSIVHFNA